MASDAFTTARTGNTSPPPIQREWVRLFRQLSANRNRWGLVVLVYRDPERRDATANELDRRWGGARRVLATDPRHTDWMALEDTLADAAASGVRAMQILDFERWLGAAGDRSSRLLGHMNFRREGFADRVTRPVLLWLRPETIRQVSLGAVDLWSWRAGLFNIAEN